MSKRITSKQISKAIEESTGDAGIMVHVDRSKGYAYFYCENPSPIDHAKSDSVYCIYALSDLTIDEWVERYRDAIDS